MAGGNQRDQDVSHVVRAAQKLAHRMGGQFIPDARLVSELENGVLAPRAQNLPLNLRCR